VWVPWSVGSSHYRTNSLGSCQFDVLCWVVIDSFRDFFAHAVSLESVWMDVIRCCIKADFVQELEDTISSLRQQVSVLQQRATLLQEDLDLRSLPRIVQTPQTLWWHLPCYIGIYDWLIDWLKDKWYSFSWNTTSELRSVTCHMVSQHLMHVNTACLTPTKHAGTARRNGRLSWLVTYWDDVAAHKRSPIQLLTQQHSRKSNAQPVDHKSDPL